jgi:hypothetical protein
LCPPSSSVGGAGSAIGDTASPVEALQNRNYEAARRDDGRDVGVPSTGLDFPSAADAAGASCFSGFQSRAIASRTLANHCMRWSCVNDWSTIHPARATVFWS